MAGAELIVGYESSEQGDDALALGLALAGAVGARLTIAAVVPAAGGEDGEGSGEAAARERLAAAVEERLAGAEAELCVLFGRSPAGALDELAGRCGAGAIVIGSSRHGRLGSVLPGSVSTGLLSGAPCAVAVAPRGYGGRGEHAMRRLGVALDESREGAQALVAAAGLARRAGATLLVCAVAEPAPIGYGATIAILSAGEFEAYEERTKQRILDEALSSLPDDLAAEGTLRRGQAARELVGLSREVDLLVVGSRGYGPIRRTLLGSTAAALMREAASPVLVLPRSAEGDVLGGVAPADPPGRGA